MLGRANKPLTLRDSWQHRFREMDVHAVSGAGHLRRFFPDQPGRARHFGVVGEHGDAPAEAFVLATAAVGGVSDSNGLGGLVNGIVWDELGYRV